MQCAVANWCDIRGRSHEQVAEMIRADRVDVLIDLGSHTAMNRLGALCVSPRRCR